MNIAKHLARLWDKLPKLSDVFNRNAKLDTDSDWDKLRIRIIRKLEKRLKGFTPGQPNSFGDVNEIDVRPNRADYPVPGLVLFVLRTFLKYPVVWHREEKTSWSVHGLLNETGFIVELRKSGFVFVFPEGTKESTTKRVVGQLGGAVSSIEKELKIIVNHQVENGNVTIPNRFHEFANRYRFFRKKAEEAYHEDGFTPAPDDNEIATSMKRMMHRRGTSSDGFYFTIEMVDAYFSLLEHILLLHFAFLNHFKEKGQLITFLRANWEIKFKTIVNIAQIQGCDQTWGELKAIKEAIRNPFAHGGNENDGSSLFVHLPGGAAVPASLNGFRNSLRFDGLLPIERNDFEDACKLFDEVDLLLTGNGLELSHKMIEGSIEPAFDQSSQKEYFDAQTSLQATEEYIEAWTYNWERWANFE